MAELEQRCQDVLMLRLGNRSVFKVRLPHGHRNHLAVGQIHSDGSVTLHDVACSANVSRLNPADSDHEFCQRCEKVQQRFAALHRSRELWHSKGIWTIGSITFAIICAMPLFGSQQAHIGYMGAGDWPNSRCQALLCKEKLGRVIDEPLNLFGNICPNCKDLLAPFENPPCTK